MRFVHWLLFHVKMLFVGISPRRIRETYALILEADLPDFTETEEGSDIYLRAMGNEVHFQDKTRDLEFVMHDDERGRVRVDQLSKDEHWLVMDGVRIKSYWYPVYREGSRADDLTFYETLEDLRKPHGTAD